MDRGMYHIGINCAEQLSLTNATLENLVDEVDWYKKYAVSYNDPYFAGLADGLWRLIQECWEYVPRGSGRNDT